MIELNRASSSENEVNMMTRISGWWSRNARHASTPPPLGIRTSMTTTSGLRMPASPTPSGPSAASPTTSRPSSASISDKRPRRTTSWSSTSITRIGVLMAWRKAQRQGNPWPSPRRRGLHPHHGRRQSHSAPPVRATWSHSRWSERPSGPPAPCRLAVGTCLPFLYKGPGASESPSSKGGVMSQAELDSAAQGTALAPAMSTLLATDGSDHALKAARFVARLLPAGAQIRLLVVLSMELQPRTYLGELSDAEARRARIEDATEEAVAETRRILEAAGHTVSVRRRFGNPPDETLAEVEEWQPDLVVVGRRGLGRASSFLLGSVSSYLLRHSPAPVLVVP